MKTKNTSNDFPQVTIDFLTRLSRNNNREWFERHKDDFQNQFLEPAQRFALEIGGRLQDFVPNIVAIPKIDHSIFRLHRDVRFSKNKSPYKTNLGIYFWEGKRKKLDSSGFYFHVEPKLFFIGVGHYVFPKDLLVKYRDAVADPEQGRELVKIINKITKNKSYEVGGKFFKKIPKGYPSDLPQSDFLLYNGLYTYYESENINQILSGKAIDLTMKIFKDMLPLHEWLVKIV